jgi:hypothetical protein
LTMSTPWRASAARSLAFGHARQAAQMERCALQRPRDGAALIACHSSDENRSIARHS